jgi:CelD/BcsL family acetyltransferase involved in cellulose biosynthesis
MPDETEGISRSATVRAFRGLRGLEELRPAWDAIAAPWGSPMLTPAWIRAWAEVYGLDADLEYLVAGDGPALTVAPLVRSRKGGLRYELGGPDSLIEVTDFLYEDGRHVPAISRALVRSRIPLRFWRIPADSPVVPALTEAYQGRGIVRCQPATGCPTLPLDASWETPETHLDSKGRSNLRRARRIAEGMGEVTTEILSPGPEQVGPLLDEAYRVEAEGWKSREGSPLARDPLLGPFFRRYATAAAETGELRVAFLRIGGRGAAMKLASVTGNRFWLLAMGFSEEFERCSPGTLLFVETLKYAVQSGLRSYEFLGAEEPWVRTWTQVQRPCVSLRTYPFGARGAIALASDATDRVRFRARHGKAWVGHVYLDVQRRLALAYSAGPTPEDALRTAESLTTLGYPVILGYMNADNEDPRLAARASRAAVEGIAANGFDGYVSIKAPALGFDRHLISGIVQAGKARGLRIHFDALGAADVDRTFSVIQDVRAIYGNLSTTLPSRWKRSLADADRIIDLGLPVRVIKGEWVEPKEREQEPRAGFLEIVDRLAGRVPQVAVATHNPVVAQKAVRRLKAAGTPCEIEVVRGYPIHRVLPVAVEEGVRVRVYIPFGNLAFPYTMGQVLRRPRIMVWVVRDMFRGGTSVVPADPRTKGGAAPTRERRA